MLMSNRESRKTHTTLT